MNSGYLNGKNVLLFAQNECEYSRYALSCLEALGCNVTTGFGNFRGEPFDDTLSEWEGDFIFSFKCYWKIPCILLRKSKSLAINFHPATPEYPGSGSYSWALYEKQKQYGVTVHKMNSKIDNGPIIEVFKFKIDETCTLQQLIDETNQFSAKVFVNFIQALDRVKPKDLHKLGADIDVSWNGVARKISDLDDMSKLTIDMTKEEVALRIRAFSLKKFPLILTAWGLPFKLEYQQSV